MGTMANSEDSDEWYFIRVCNKRNIIFFLKIINFFTDYLNKNSKGNLFTNTL